MLVLHESAIGLALFKVKDGKLDDKDLHKAFETEEGANNLCVDPLSRSTQPRGPHAARRKRLRPLEDTGAGAAQGPGRRGEATRALACDQLLLPPASRPSEAVTPPACSTSTASHPHAPDHDADPAPPLARSVKLQAIHRFTSTASAVEDMTAIGEGKLSKSLKKFLTDEVVGNKKLKSEKLAVSEPKLGASPSSSSLGPLPARARH